MANLLVMTLLTPAAAMLELQAGRGATWENITVYHVNPHKYGAIPVNMDIADSTGDLFFDLDQVMVVPLACADAKHAGHSCSNPEADGKDLMVNKLTLSVNTDYSTYAKCNIGVNGTDHHGHACKDDTYCCFCSGSHWGPDVPCNTTLGRENLYETHGSRGGCRSGSTASSCYSGNVAKKLDSQYPGFWFSSLDTGYCGATGAAPDCTWRVVAVEKIVTRECHTKVFGDLVQASAPPDCLNSCGTQKTNSSSPCWTDCFYKAALGPESGTPGGAVAGMPIGDLVAAWEKPFLPEAQGGCPPQQELPSWYQPRSVPVPALGAVEA